MHKNTESLYKNTIFLNQQNINIIVPSNLILDERLNLQDLRMYVYLKTRQGRNKYSFPKIELISLELRMSRSTVCRILKKLELLGWITRERQYKAPNKYICNTLNYNPLFIKNHSKKRINNLNSNSEKNNIILFTKSNHN